MFQDFLMHEGRSKMDGAPVGSGRYPLGSGEDAYQHAKDFRTRLLKLRKEGITDPKELASYFGVPTRTYRKMVTSAKATVDREDYYRAKELRAQGYSEKKIGEMLGRSTTNVHGLLARDGAVKANTIDTTADLLRKSLNDLGGYIDVGKGSNLYMGVSETKFQAAIKQLTDSGDYVVVNTAVQQLFGQGATKLQILGPAGTTKEEIYANMDKIREPKDVKIDKDGEVLSLRPIQNIDSKRVAVRYAEEGGIDRDGVIELRRGVKDLDLGLAKYAQVRIGVDGTHYLKGMAVYSDDLPDGIDIRFNTNKHQGTPKLDVLKPMKEPDNELNPFGASIRPGLQRGALNIVNEEGHWSDWSRTLSAQFLSKQAPALAKKQLELSADVAKSDLDEIMSLTNPTVKRFLLNKYAEARDSDACMLKAAALPRQESKIILPVPSLKDNEVYAPTYKNGEWIALVRHPHGGIFEIPILKVNNKNVEGKSIMGQARDAIGINSKNAGILSGADFDGDTVLTIPIKSANIRNYSPEQLDSNPTLKKTYGTLRSFDPKEAYPGTYLSPSRYMTKKGTSGHMGRITNLITDMTIQGANPEEITRAVKYSMVVIDAAKHKLDYHKAYKDFGIAELTKRYRPSGGGTIISRARGQAHVPDYKVITSVKSMTPEEQARYWKGEIIKRPTGKTKWKDGSLVKIKSKQMAETDDPYSLTSGGSRKHPGTLIERHYAEYASRMKALANEARKAYRTTPRATWNRSLAKEYATEIASLDRKLQEAEMNRPKERRAQALANSTYNLDKDNHPEWEDDDKKKAKSRALEYARSVTGAGKKQIKLTAKEWEAIQNGAISDSKVEVILENSDIDVLRSWSMPKTSKAMSTSKKQRALQMLERDYTWEEVARQLGVSISTLQRELK